MWICGTECCHNGTLPGGSHDISINFGPRVFSAKGTSDVEANGLPWENAVHLISNVRRATEDLNKAILACSPQSTSASELVKKGRMEPVTETYTETATCLGRRKLLQVVCDNLVPRKWPVP